MAPVREAGLMRKESERGFERAAAGIGLLAPDGTFMRVNARLCEILDRAGADLVGRRFQEIAYPADRHRDEECIRRLLAGEVASYGMEKRFLRPDGSPILVDLRVSLVREPTGEPDHLVVVLEDVTEREHAEERARRGEEVPGKRTSEPRGSAEVCFEAIRRAYVDVLDAATGGKLVLMTPEELERALGEPLTQPRPLRGREDFTSARDEVRAAVSGVLRGVDELLNPLGEAMNNALKHAGGGEWRLFRDGVRIQALVEDRGPGIDFRGLPKAAPVPGSSTRSILGMGFTIMLQMCDRVLLTTQPGLTRVVPVVLRTASEPPLG